MRRLTVAIRYKSITIGYKSITIGYYPHTNVSGRLHSDIHLEDCEYTQVQAVSLRIHYAPISTYVRAYTFGYTAKDNGIYQYTWRRRAVSIPTISLGITNSYSAITKYYSRNCVRFLRLCGYRRNLYRSHPL